MNEHPDHLTAVLHEATEHLHGDPASAQRAWSAARRRTRRRTTTAVLGAAASVALVVGLVAAWPTRTSDPSPTPSPGPTPSRTVDGGAGPRIDPMYDPAGWEDLPEYPVDLGYWLSPDRPRPLAELPLERALVAVSYFFDPEGANVSVIGADGRWRSLDTTGLTFVDEDDYEVGLSPRSLSPDGTRLALGQPDGVVVFDLRTAERRAYPVSGLDGLSAGRAVSWTSDGAAVLLGQAYVADDDGIRSGPAYQPGFRVDLETGDVSRLDYDPEHAAQLTEQAVVADLWTEEGGHRIVALGQNGARTEWDGVEPYLGYADSFAGQGTRWAVRREVMGGSDTLDGLSGFLVFEGQRPLALLPSKGLEQNGGGGRIIGWLDDATLLVAVPGHGIPERQLTIEETVAWDVVTGELWRGPEILSNSRVSVAPLP